MKRLLLDVVNVSHSGGRILRVAVLRDSEGVPQELLLVDGWEEEGGWSEILGNGITIPGSALPQVHAALGRLVGDNAEKEAPCS